MRRLLITALAALLAACASTPPATVATDAALFRPLLTEFDVRGRLAARNGEEAVSGRFAWQHSPGYDRWDFFSPTGQIVARLTSERGEAVLLLADGTELAEPLSPLLARVLGMEVPVGAMPRWLQGGVASRDDVRETDELGRPRRVSEQGWQIRYPEYAAERDDARPRAVELSRGEARLRLVIDEWR